MLCLAHYAPLMSEPVPHVWKLPVNTQSVKGIFVFVSEHTHARLGTSVRIEKLFS